MGSSEQSKNQKSKTVPKKEGHPSTVAKRRSSYLKTLDNTSFKKHLTRIISISVLFIILSMAFSHSQFVFRDSLRDKQDMYANTELVALKLMKNLISMEASIRGYTLTQNDSFLEPYYEGKRKISEYIEEVFNLSTNDYELSKAFRKLNSSIQRWEQSFIERSIRSTQAGITHTANFEMESKQAFDAIRSDFDFFNSEVGIRKLRTQRAYIISRNITYVLEALTAIALAIFIYFLLKKQIHQLTYSYRQVLRDNEKYVKKLEDASKSKDLFLANMSHEIRTPLGAVLGFADLVSKDSTLSEENKKHIGFIKRNGNHLLNLVEDLFDLSKISSNKIEAHVEEIHTLTLLYDLKDVFSSKTSDKHIDFKFRLKTSIPEIFESDPIRLKQILTNLIGNAIKFSDKNGQVLLQATYSSRCLVFDVIDNGVGIPPDSQQSIFNSFQQADAGYSRKYSGAGLGLSIAKNFSKLLGGDLVLVSSSRGVGSHFQVTIPVTEASDKMLTQDMYESQIASYHHTDEYDEKEKGITLENVKVLLAEDSKENQILFRTYLESVGADIAVADNGGEAVRQALSNDFDIVLMDIQMPGLDGYEALKILKESDFKKKIIALTAHALKGEKNKCLEKGFDGYLSKPVSKNKLVNYIYNHLS